MMFKVQEALPRTFTRSQGPIGVCWQCSLRLEQQLPTALRSRRSPTQRHFVTFTNGGFGIHPRTPRRNLRHSARQYISHERIVPRDSGRLSEHNEAADLSTYQPGVVNGGSLEGDFEEHKTLRNPTSRYRRLSALLKRPRAPILTIPRPNDTQEREQDVLKYVETPSLGVGSIATNTSRLSHKSIWMRGRVGAPAGKEWSALTRRATLSCSGPYISGAGVIRGRSFISKAHDSRPVAGNLAGELQKEDPPVDLGQLGKLGIRAKLRQWEEDHKAKDAQVRADSDLFHSDVESRAFLGTGIRKTLDDRVTDLFPSEDAELDGTPANNNMNEDGVNSDLPAMVLEIGDLVELATDDLPILAIFIARYDTQNQFYTMKGRWLHKTVGPGRYSFIVRGFCNASEVTPLFPYLPRKEISLAYLGILHTLPLSIPRVSGASILVEKMNRFAQDANEVYRAHLQRMDQAHELIADKHQIVFKTLPEIASIILQVPHDRPIPSPALWAVHQVITLKEPCFIPNTQFPETGYFEIISQEELDVVRQVKKWLHEYQDSLASHDGSIPGRTPQNSERSSSLEEGQTVMDGFVARARHQISKSRAVRPLAQLRGTKMEAGGLGPQYENTIDPLMTGATFAPVRGTPKRSPEDVVILRFIELWCIRQLFRTSHHESSLGPMILRAVGMYGGFNLHQGMGYTFLQEMGVIAPWDTLPRLNVRLLLPDAHWKVALPECPDTQGATTEMDKEDSMRDLRRDWGDLEVFCIDPVGAVEIDDGISIEVDPNDKSSHWIHVHVANPTAFMNSDDPKARYASFMVSSQYLPEKVYSMLPRSASKASWSLGSNRPCLTFSARVGANGEIMEYKIQHGIIRKVTFVTPETVSAAIRQPGAKFAPEFKYMVGDILESKAIPSGKQLTETLTDGQKEDLRKLHELALILKQKRVAFVASARILETRSHISVRGAEVTQPHETDTGIAMGDPTIVCEGQLLEPDLDENLVTAESFSFLVSEMMVLACHVAGRWCAERRIPVPFRGTFHRSDGLPDEHHKEKFLEICANQPHAVRYLAYVKYLRSLGVFKTSSFPIEHKHLNLPVYVKVTSPLRRYADMVSHWQIESVLRAQAAASKELITVRDDEPYLHFSRKELDSQLPWITMQEHVIRDKDRLAAMCWRAQLLNRAYSYHQDPSLPKTFQALIFKKPDRPGAASGMIRELNMPCVVLENSVAESHKGLAMTDWWHVRPTAFDTFRGTVVMEPIELIKRQGVAF